MSDEAYETTTDQPVLSYLPRSLIQAIGAIGEYMLKLRTGEVITFHNVEIRGEWACLALDHGNIKFVDGVGGRHSLPFHHGIDVRLRDIVWCAEADQ